MKSFFLKSLLFLIIGVNLFLLWGWFWGFWGAVSKEHFRLLVNVLPPWQKQEFADALNYYYDNNVVTKYTSGYILRCKPETDSIEKQFNWFYRNTASAMFNEMPSYHEIVKEALLTQMDDEMLPANASTFELEMILEKILMKQGQDSMTTKDKIGLGLTGLSLGVKILTFAINPYAGAALTVAGVAQASMSDSAKAVPGIICFLGIRNRNFSYCFLLTWGLSVFFFYRPSTKKKKSKKKTT